MLLRCIGEWLIKICFIIGNEEGRKKGRLEGWMEGRMDGGRIFLLQKYIKMKKSFGAILLLIVCFNSRAFVKPNSLFSNNMVLQRGVEVPIWGTANEGEKVTVAFCGQRVSTITMDGKWMVKLKALKINSKPSTMTISGENSITIENILVGEVWVCSGQSNMEMMVGSAHPKPITNVREEIANANYPAIRQYHIAKIGSDTLVSDANTNWVVCDTFSVKNFTAVGYFFARDLYKTMKVPIGLLFTAFGGTPAENWTPRSTLESNPEFKKIVDGYKMAMMNYPILLDSFNHNKSTILAKWAADTLAASLAQKPIPKKPEIPRNPIGGAGGLYNAMINPLIPYAIKGVLWYQGEANNLRAKKYQILFPMMIEAWRKNWNLGEFPFLFVQIAPYREMNPAIREAQLLTLNKVSNTAMVVTTDCGDSITVHPAFKQPIGNRLSLAARALAYHEKIEYSGPLYKSFEVKGNTIEVSFTHNGKGLMAKDGDLKGFTISADGKNFVTATAEIKGDKVIVYSTAVTSPKAVRYGWADFPRVNLYNMEGFPASPFRTDEE